MKFVLFLCALFISLATAATPEEWRSRSIYQLLTDRFARTDGSTMAACNTEVLQYCGGTWRGIIDHLDYIQDMGFDAVWISPITLNRPLGFHGYWQTDIYSLNPHFGDEHDLRDLSDALHGRGMYLMVDIVVNHFASTGDPYSVDYSQFVPLNSSDYFHDYCEISGDAYNLHTLEVEICWVHSELPDVDTNHPQVIEIFNSWISDLVSTYSIDGLRIDTAKHVQKPFWPEFNKAAGVYSVGEVLDGNPTYTCPYQDVMDGVLNYPLYFSLTEAFKSTTGSMWNLANQVNAIKSQCKDTSLLGTFLENHDQPRFPSLTPDMSLAKNAIAFTMLTDGIPIIYAGQEHHYNSGNDPYNRDATWHSQYSTQSELYRFIAALNGIRSYAIKQASDYLQYQAHPIYTDDHTIAMRKGFEGSQVVSVFSNLGIHGPNYMLRMGGTGYREGEVVVDILTCWAVVPDQYGNIVFSMGGGVPRIFYPAHQLRGSGICRQYFEEDLQSEQGSQIVMQQTLS